MMETRSPFQLPAPIIRIFHKECALQYIARPRLNQPMKLSARRKIEIQILHSPTIPSILFEIKMNKVAIILTVMAATTLGGCATWSTSSIENAPESHPQAVKVNTASKTPMSEIQITEADITERPYKSLGDISVTVNKTTLFHPDPTREMVDQKLRE